MTKTSVTPDKSRPARHRLVRFLIGTARFIVAAYFGVFIILIFNQTALIFPGSQVRDPLAVVKPTDGAQLVDRASTGDAHVLGLVEPALGVDGKRVADVADRPTLIYCYGNGSNVADSLDTVRRFRTDGVNVFIPGYDGFGMNGGQ